MFRTKPNTAFAAGLVLASLAMSALPVLADEAPADSTLALQGDQAETVFRSLTVEGENRIRIEFDRPTLAVDLDPSSAPGLAWGSPHDILDRTVPDLESPLLATSATMPSPYAPRPWLAGFKTGPVATFTNDLEGVESWHLQVMDSRGREVTAFSGKGDPPREIAWDGADADGNPVAPGLTYSFLLETYDKAGNKRHFSGNGFDLAAYRTEGPNGYRFLASGDQWRDTGAPGDKVSMLLLETASAFNVEYAEEIPIEIRATARTYAAAEALGNAVADKMAPLLIGGRSRLVVTTVVEEAAPQGGTLLLQVAFSRSEES